MATHTQLPIYKAAYDLLGVVSDFVKQMPRDFKQSIGGKINAECIEITVLVFRATLANILLKRGHCVKADLTETYRKYGAI